MKYRYRVGALLFLLAALPFSTAFASRLLALVFRSICISARTSGAGSLVSLRSLMPSLKSLADGWATASAHGSP